MSLANTKLWGCVGFEGNHSGLLEFRIRRSDRAIASQFPVWGEHGSRAIVLGSNSLLIVAYGGVDTAVSRLAIVIYLGSVRHSIFVSVALERI